MKVLLKIKSPQDTYFPQYIKLNGSAPKPAVNGLMLVCLVLNTLSELQKCEKRMSTKMVCIIADQGKLQTPLLSLITD